ncbi:RNI-like protein, partial [Suhomyces tanzawaensis NRRL Y-17324]
NSTTDNSDLESLPDLTEDDGTPTTTPLKRRPSIKSCFFQDPIQPKKLLFTNPSALLPSTPLSSASPSIFDIPELVHKIVEYASLQNTVIPQESTPVRRKPLSYNHAMLIHGNKEQAESALLQKQYQSEKPGSCNGVLFNCLQVNKLFYQVTMEVLSKNFFFSDEIQFSKLAASISTRTCQLKLKPTSFVLHKLFMLKQSAIDMIKDHIDFSDLEWLELYMCPKLYPTIEFFQLGGHRLKKLIITGSKVIDDEFLIMVSKHCPNLEVLDIRACELVSDSGVYQIAKNCRKLTNINFGRKQRGHLITDSSLSILISNNRGLVTVGLAGCHVSDRAVWDLAVHCSGSLQRLSLNNCPYITNQSIPLILTRPNINYPTSYFQNLSVLELRFDVQITNWQPIIEFKRRQEYRGISILIEVCETLMVRMRQHELEMDRAISQRIFRDILDWVNDANDGDLLYHQLLESRR